MGYLIRNGVIIGGTTVYVDDELSLLSTNPVQNNIVTNALNNITPLSLAYDNTATYNVNDYCIYNNNLYRCIVDITVAEDFTAAHWELTTVINDVKTTYNNIVTVTNTGDMYVGNQLVRKVLTQEAYDLLNPPDPKVDYKIIETTP